MSFPSTPPPLDGVVHTDVRVDGVRWHVATAGDGPPVLLVHGWPQHWWMWRKVIPDLARDHRVIVPDLRGSGWSDAPAGDYSKAGLARDLDRLLGELGVDSCTVVGHDWGALVGWALGAWHPDRVRTLTVLSVPHPGAMAKAMVTSDQALRSAYMAAFQVPVLPEQALLAGAGAPLRRMLRRSGLPDQLADHYVSRMREPGALTAALNWYRALPWHAGDPVGRVTVPTLHVWSTDDTFLGRTATEDTARFCSGAYRLEVLEGVPHWIPELAAEQLGELVVAHVRSA